ncbi:MAG: hypothetical protein KAQ67_09685 [Gammaproteobacteria bacterium]|nr:hypothetical protein [Gammaproteobacteria bacterium]
MFRSLILMIAIGVVIWLLSRMFKNKTLQSRPKQNNEIKNIVQCHVCNVFIPEDKAIKQDQYSFCSQDHLNQWKNHS